MLIKISKTLLTCINLFKDKLPHDKAWDIYLEVNQSLSFDLNKGPTCMQIMGFFARCIFLPSHHLQTFETSFITLGLSIFSPTMHDITLQYIAYRDAK